ncbi:hypothetical protein [Chitinophaga nivalis]|uniref:Uncharacterized protein n=1 Tax=Chitinophaga nivalis TaxID=2991709 RepID=A0ABT3ISV3_9BACT|nr:hypothetical protein [Chitinophaga nivalis]MCW3463505.1 hypothetical protein [Chitinophaga nivalis]MCW3486805.1 hypothetical protein [Chitinophaga nivalis]
MPVLSNIVYASLKRQITHWLQAASRLSALDHLASLNAWQGLDNAIVQSLRKSLQTGIAEVVGLGKSLAVQLELSKDQQEWNMLRKGVITLRNKYLMAEETIHFFTVAVNSRTTPNVAALLRACDILCVKSMEALLKPLGKEAPLVLTYIDKGIGASILKAGLRLWDGNISTVAAVKITQHNLFRPTAIIHETGHQIAHILNWNEELADGLRKGLHSYPPQVGMAYAGWASEIAADAFAFVHTGYAAVAALSDVLSGEAFTVFAFRAKDPHPISYVRVMMNIAMCKAFFGTGPWDDLATAFENDYNIDRAEYLSVPLIRSCMEAMPEVINIILRNKYRAFGGQSLSQLIPPAAVSPKELNKLEYIAGPALFTSHAWISKECLRLLALIGYKIGTGQGDLAALYKLQEEWMIKLGFSIPLN